MTNIEALTTSLAMLGEAFNREVTDLTAEAYLLALGDLSAEELARATKAAMASCKFFPTAAELLALAGRDPAAEMAASWEAVRTAMDRFDYTRSVDFGPLVNAVIRNMGGWGALCAASIPDLTWRRKDFERIYAAFAGKAPAALHGAPLRGSLPGAPVRIAIGGKAPPLQIEGATSGTSRIARMLAEAKT